MKHGQTHGGKGSAPRKVNNEKFAENWDKIFGKNKDDTEHNGSLMPNIAGAHTASKRENK